eukprot:1161078-Pelagomonas_calceolata.AAC.11
MVEDQRQHIGKLKQVKILTRTKMEQIIHSRQGLSNKHKMIKERALYLLSRKRVMSMCVAASCVRATPSQHAAVTDPAPACAHRTWMRCGRRPARAHQSCRPPCRASPMRRPCWSSPLRTVRPDQLTELVGLPLIQAESMLEGLYAQEGSICMCMRVHSHTYTHANTQAVERQGAEIGSRGEEASQLQVALEASQAEGRSLEEQLQASQGQVAQLTEELQASLQVRPILAFTADSLCAVEGAEVH